TVGMAFSGGGIRSASFNFGLVQGLAQYNALPWVDYLSSVSGGGFTAGCLTTLLSFDQKDEKGRREYYHFNTQWDYFPLNPGLKVFDSQGAAHTREATAEEKKLKIGPPLAKGTNSQLLYLRNKGNYLIPRMGWLTRDFMRGIGAVLIRMSYTLFVFLVTLFALSALVQGFTSALIPIQDPLVWPTVEKAGESGEMAQVTDTGELLYRMFGFYQSGQLQDPPAFALDRYPIREYALTLLLGFALAIATGLGLTGFYLEDPTQKKKLRPWKSKQAGVTTLGYLKIVNLRNLALLVFLVLSLLTAWVWLSHYSFSSLINAPQVIFYYSWLLLMLIFFLGAIRLVASQFQDFRWVSQGLDETERFDNLVLQTVAWLNLWGVSLWLAWLRMRSFDQTGAEQALFWVWLPAVFLLGALLGLALYRLLQLSYKVVIAQDGIRYEDRLSSLTRSYYDWILSPDQEYRDSVRALDEQASPQAGAGEPASTEPKKEDKTFSQSFWAGAGYRSIFWSLQGLALYGLLASLLFVAFTLPHYFQKVQEAGSTTTIPLATALISSLWASLLAAANRRQDSPAGNLLARILTLPERLRNYALGLLVLLLVLSLVFIFQALLHGQNAYQALLLAGIATALLGVSGWLVDFNYLTPHYFFRDRMADVFLMTQVEKEPGQAKGDGAIITVRDDRDERLSWITPRDCSAPYHLVQTTLNLPGSSHLRLKDRKSQSFIFSKYYCGSEITGYVDNMRAYRGGSTQYARAIALSGAAVSSGLGYHTFFAQAFMTTLLNIRLGLWMTNPAEYAEQKLAQDPKPHQRVEKPFWPAYLWDEASAQISERRAMVNLTDGEHCGDNNGLYPLFQRRCKYIIVGDGGQDPEGRCDSLFQVLRQVKMDFGIEVKINVQGLKPAKYDREKKETEPSARHFAVGKIYYPSQIDGGVERPAEQGWLFYFKPAVTRQDPASILNYWEKNRLNFPHPSTADQFFDEDQFEIQRYLGEWTVTHTLQVLATHYAEKISALENQPRPSRQVKAEIDKLTTRRDLVQALMADGELDFDTLANQPAVLTEFLEDLLEISDAGIG
ncbi:MAG: patatin-like phospholipase family protein, partial [Anaerolineales bacterium]